ncbi:potassium transporter Kup [Microbulbifer pacificus]|uniref:Probable potassium transport system protein Kup n=1 Tax=Microbulbifer pacificus TaxID=407164 RepID=A0AAU0MZX3_9GAMM|nr:potassium transporter Kup [Microbulbifer pacificus]WOX05612.1 potassium transporter Kup [Microbulbifer pacificus]
MTESTRENGPSRAALTLAALGIVFGDIGTSPLYAVKLIFHSEHGLPLTQANILGGISAIFWALMLLVTIKYVLLIMRADNDGEGGIMALTALALAATRGHNRRMRWLIATAGLCGVALFFGDAVITPAISVLSAIEGLEVGVEFLHPFVLPLTIVVLVALFFLQRFGTAMVGALFGPITALWFLVLMVSGIHATVGNPAILQALNPIHALVFITSHGVGSFAILGAVLLVFTGAEALYADMGHFGRGPIKLAWGGLVFPALTLNYLGQGALLMSEPGAVDNPFFRMFPSWALYPMVALATAATVIASQACISGVFSLAKQAIQLGYLPRMAVRHTSPLQAGQIYMPGINWLLLILVLAAVIGFGSSSNLAAAYGVAVSGAMLMDTVIASFVYRFRWHYPLAWCAAGAIFFSSIDVAFFSSSLMKIGHGGWFPLAIAATAMVLMITWRDGRKVLIKRLQLEESKLGEFLNLLFRDPPLRVPGTAVFMTSKPESVPHALLHNLKHNKVLHERVLFLNVKVVDRPRVPLDQRYRLHDFGNGCTRIRLYYGFMQSPDIAQALQELGDEHGLQVDPQQASFFLSRETIFPLKSLPSGMAYWRERIFAVMARNASSAVEYFGIPANRVIELGTQIEI